MQINLTVNTMTSPVLEYTTLPLDSTRCMLQTPTTTPLVHETSTTSTAQPSTLISDNLGTATLNGKQIVQCQQTNFMQLKCGTFLL